MQKTSWHKLPALSLNPYAPIGQSQETPQQIAAKRERAAIQRNHRRIACACGSPSPTPNMLQLMTGNTARSSSVLSTYFICNNCSLPQSVMIQSTIVGIANNHHKYLLQSSWCGVLLVNMRCLKMDLPILFLVLRVLRCVTHVTSKVLIKMNKKKMMISVLTFLLYLLINHLLTMALLLQS